MSKTTSLVRKKFFLTREKYFPREGAEKSPCKMQGHDVVAWGDGNHSQMFHALFSSFVSTGLFGSAFCPIVLMLISDFVFTSTVVVSGALYFFMIP